MVFNDQTVSTSVGVTFGAFDKILINDEPEGEFDHMLFHIGQDSFMTMDESSIIYCEEKDIIYVNIYFRLSNITYNMYGTLFTDCRLGLRL